jgi:hypothetical protein
MLLDHPPAHRVIIDEATAIDRQWLKLLDEVFKNVSYDDIVNAGVDKEAAVALLGLVALNDRVLDNANI